VQLVNSNSSHLDRLSPIRDSHRPVRKPNYRTQINLPFRTVNVVNFSPTGRVVPRNIHRLLASLDSTLKLMLMMPTALERTIVAFEVFGN